MKLIIIYILSFFILVSEFTLSTPVQNSTSCPLLNCPGVCSIGFVNGCQTCSCPRGVNATVKSLNSTTTICPEFNCPGQCSLGFANGCRTCSCPTSNPRTTTKPQNSTICPEVICPGQCSVGFANGCPTCSCPNVIQSIVVVKNCPNITCPGQCSVGFNDGCQTCTCPPGMNVTKACPDIVCPGQCSIGLTPDGCTTCDCPAVLRSPPDKCDENTPCKGVNQECTEFNFCVCTTGYSMVLATKKCVKTPILNENCIVGTDTVSCDGYGVDYECNVEKGPHYGKCICKLGYELTSSGKECRPIEKVLGQACIHDRECTVAYSYCSSNKKCSCISGFVSDKSGLCTPPAMACPSFFNGFSVNKAGKSCEVYYDPETSQEFHTCKSNEFCYQHPKTRTPQGRYFGHCCPSPPKDAGLGLVCPLTVTYNGTCPDTSDLPMDSIAPPDKIATCPFTTHDCIRQPLRVDEICCPLPCRATSSHFSVNGLCYDYVLIGEPCKHTAQCIGGSECAKNNSKLSTCQCKTGSKQASLTQCEQK